MNTRLFVHHPLFRLFSPPFGGTLVYLLLLLINNAVYTLQDTFLGQELYVCIGLAYLTQEFSRWSLLFFQRLDRPKALLLKILLQLVVSVLLTIALVTGAMYGYFKYVLLYTPNIRELTIFNSIFSFITVLYVVLSLGHYFLYRRNTEKIAQETAAKAAIEMDFLHFKKGINPDLLFESLEAMLVLMKKDADRAEELADTFSVVYRYMLSKKRREVVSIREEFRILEAMVNLFNHLPYRKVKLGRLPEAALWVVPTSLLTLVETIIRTTIASEHQILQIDIREDEGRLSVEYVPEERLQHSLQLESIPDLVFSYGFYTDTPIALKEQQGRKCIQFPNLTFDESSNH